MLVDKRHETRKAVMEIKVTLRAKNQLTLPEPILRQLGIEPGDELIVCVQEDQPEMAQLRPLRRSYAGVAAGVYGTPDEVRDYVDGEHAAWSND
ncbi:MAG: AbrB/MazE/SpoVT family DNA-binding domain-containing protein [Chloroflexota bacterium]|nr:MAG: AbrB/MazE/SpoVT family DNA-binding domain-containing protein [Chloroflexota bacterium]